jgi:hypothetical protein
MWTSGWSATRLSCRLQQSFEILASFGLGSVKFGLCLLRVELGQLRRESHE